jgi:hypothetical protein
MRSKAIIIGILIALVGVVIVSQAGEAVMTTRPYPIAYNASPDSWSISGNITAGDIFTFIYRDGVNWTEGYFEPSEDESQSATLWAYIDLIPVDPPGNLTEFMIELRLTDVQTGAGTGGSRLTVYNSSIIQEGSIDTTVVERDDKGRYQDVGGRAPWNGTYTAAMNMYPSRTAPPTYLALFHDINVTDHPNSNFLPLGGAIVVFGGTISAFGTRGVMMQTQRGRKKNERKN